MSGLTISFELHPPKSSASPPSLEPTVKHTFDVGSRPVEGYAKYYAALRDAIADARAKTGDELTQWRDAVGNSEVRKDVKGVEVRGEEEDGEEEDESEE
jgi:hypothetical protein